MIYGKYKKARNAAWQCLIDNNIRSLPIKITDVAKKSNVIIVKYSNVSSDRLANTESGSTYFINNSIYIIYRDTEPIQRCRFTVAHELGHIFLGHTLTKDKFSRKFDLSKPEFETEADIFASRLLAPACVLWGLDLHVAEEISKVCDISLSAAKIRAERMEVLYKRNKFLTSSLERKVFSNFHDFIKEHKYKLNM